MNDSAKSKMSTEIPAEHKLDATFLEKLATEDAVQGPLRVMIVTENFLPKVDGVTKTLSRLLEHLRKEGHEAVVLGPESGLSTYEGHAVYGTRGIPLLFYPGLSLNFFRPMFLRRLLAFQPDVVHYVDPIWLGTQAQPVVERYLPDVGSVSSYHTNLAMYADCYGFSFLAKYIWALQKRLHGRCNFTFCPSPSTTNVLTQHGFSNVRIWPRGADLNFFNPSRRSLELRKQWGADSGSSPTTAKPKIVMLYVGRISWEKNLAMLCEAVRLLSVNMQERWTKTPFSGFKMVLVGHGPAQVEIEKLCQVNGIDALFAGQLQGEVLARHYASADFFVFPSVSETFGNVVLEALASGLPVVGLRAEGVSDLVEDGQTGLLMNLNDSGALTVPVDAHKLVHRASPSFDRFAAEYSRLIESMILNGDRRQIMSTNAITAASQRSWPAAMNCLVRGYREVAAITRKRQAAKLKLALSRNSSTTSLREVVCPTLSEDLIQVTATKRGFARLAFSKVFKRQAHSSSDSLADLFSIRKSVGRTKERLDILPLGSQEIIRNEKTAALLLCRIAQGMVWLVCFLIVAMVIRHTLSDVFSRVLIEV